MPNFHLSIVDGNTTTKNISKNMRTFVLKIVELLKENDFFTLNKYSYTKKRIKVVKKHVLNGLFVLCEGVKHNQI